MNNLSEEPDRLMSATEVRKIFGVSDMSLWRWLADDRMQFPKPIMIRRRRYWRRGDIVSFQEKQPQSIFDQRKEVDVSHEEQLRVESFNSAPLTSGSGDAAVLLRWLSTIAADRSFKDAQVRIATLIACRFGNGTRVPSADTLAELIRWEKRTVASHLLDLSRAGFLAVRYDGETREHHNRYFIMAFPNAG